MDTINCLIVDDEPLAQEVLEKYISTMTSIKLIAKCNNAAEAVSIIYSEQIDLLFLDIKMPGISGIDFLKSLTKPPLVILTTAYSEYALESYNYSVLDYLLKPISYERFLKAMNKAFERKNALTSANIPQKHSEADFIFLYIDKQEYKVKYADILYVEAYGNFVKVYTKEKTLVVAMSLKSIEESLPESFFLRVHKSYIVSLYKVDRIAGNVIWIQNHTLPVGRYYKNNVTKALNLFRIGM